MKYHLQKYYKVLVLFLCTIIFVLFGQIVIAQSNYIIATQGKQKVELIVGGDFIVTMNEAQPIVENGAIAIQNGKILAVGTQYQIMKSYRADRTLPGDGLVLMPGLVNGHSHSAMVLFRGLADDLALQDWLENYIFPAEGKFASRCNSSQA
ncbi:MAG: hypothetical protein RMX96_07420 [Nostoc sp. ChiSLP02]|nr:hypothetical protein [Nostoc sp. DedSLP05]MDZ8099338.1 hypothetical protein [Nostoc sp. DedSLP01]MDZ8184663.1 hypothetical protein [Nostoc sp. ChiSLP02]